MAYHLDDTICAVATAAAGGAARGIIRVSGRQALEIVGPLFRNENGLPFEAPNVATAIAGNLRIPLQNSSSAQLQPQASASEQCRTAIVPCDLFVWPNEKSYTREAVMEVHTIGSRPILEAVLAAVCCAGARLAEPGEFTLRAFLAGRLDLTQAEAVLGVIDASHAHELSAALAQLAGGLARPLHRVRDDLLQLLAELEAGLDFVDEDIQFVSGQEVVARLGSAVQILEDVGNQMTSRQSIAAAHQVALVGPPNAGKSSLFNALTRRFGVDRNRSLAAEALVSPSRGTTRDYLTATISVGPIHCELIDTAGNVAHKIEETGSSTPSPSGGSVAEIDSAAAALGAERSRRATVRALCLDASQLPMDSARDRVVERLLPACDLLILTKADLVPCPIMPNLVERSVPTVVTSSRTGIGLDELGNALCRILASDETAPRGCTVASTADRCRESIHRAISALAGAHDLAACDQGNELVASDIRLALDELGKVVGAIYTEDLLDRIFSSFCIGK
jgi:tRNA modification GTPase